MQETASQTLAQAEAVYARRLQEDLETIVGRLRDMGAELVVLFGSAARGRRDLFTDLDLLVVLPSDLPFVERTGTLYRQLGARADMDLFACTPAEFEAMRKRPFVRRALAEGKVLYARRPEWGGGEPGAGAFGGAPLRGGWRERVGLPRTDDGMGDPGALLRAHAISQ